jgi:Protein of unknown function (DUF2752)
MKKNIDKIWLPLLLLEPIVLWLLPGDFFDNTGFELCPSKALFNIECLGCGMTRAVMHFHHFEFSDAIFFNYGVVAIYPALVVVWFIWVKRAANRLGILKHGKQEQPAA